MMIANMTPIISVMDLAIMLHRYGLVLLLLAGWSAAPIFAQEHDIINAENFTQLQPAQRIDFVDAPEAAGRIDTGLFMLSSDATRIATINRANHIVVWDDAGSILSTVVVMGADGLPGTFIGGAISLDGTALVSLHTDGASYLIAYHRVDDDMTAVIPFPNLPDIPVTIWLDHDSEYIWLEVLPEQFEDPQYVMRLRLDDLEADSIVRLFDVPGNDAQAFARIGRVLAPYAITVSEDGFVKRWNLELGQVTATVDLDSIPVFGQINTRGSHLAWRDPLSEALHLLDFRTGEDRIVATLDGDLIPFVLLSSEADVIFGVNVNLESNIFAWNTVTGAIHDYGAFGRCGREQPDMVRLSLDGTALVIGCQAGIEIWRVAAT